MEKEGCGSTPSSPGRPFQLRPSALSASSAGGSAFGPFGINIPSNPFLLRPSALTAIADKLDNAPQALTPRKRSIGSPINEETEEDMSKKQRLSETDSESPEKPKERLVLTEPIEKPTGIGTFGFGDKPTNGETTSDNAANQSSSSASSYGFVFGQNAVSSVTGFSDVSGRENEEKEVSPEKNEEIVDIEKERALVQAADEHMKRADSAKLHLKEVDVYTGEEGEKNVLLVECKLHLFDGEKKNWVERGRGVLKLNDICQSDVHGIFQSRIVFRTHGSHLVHLNTMLWLDMRCEKSSNRTIRITAMESTNTDVKVYLVTASPKDTIQLYTAIDRRIQALKRNQESNSSLQTEEDSNDYTESRGVDEDDSRSEDAGSSICQSREREIEGSDKESEERPDSDEEKNLESENNGNEDSGGEDT